LVGDRYRLVSLPADVYSLSNVPFHTRAYDVALAALIAFILSLLATLYPAHRAARVPSAQALRDG
jgi:lipoprotein-releasing system permease protein